MSAIILASIDSPLGSLTTSFVTDIYRTLIRKDATEHHYLWVSRVTVIGFGLLLAFIAFMCSKVDGILWFAYKITGLTGGSMLGVFLLGLFTKRPANRANIIAMIFNTICMTILLILSENKIINLCWSWIIVIGTVVTFGLGYLLGPRLEKNLSCSRRR